MVYNLLNIEKGILFKCDSLLWEKAMEFAENSGWEPEGTFFDFEFEVDNHVDGQHDEMYNLFMLILQYQRRNEWDGNYTEMENQVVTGTDAYYFSLALGDTPDFSLLVEFLRKGSFRICSDL